MSDILHCSELDLKLYILDSGESSEANGCDGAGMGAPG